MQRHKETCGEGNGNPLLYSCLENPRDRGAWWAAIYGVAQSQTRLEQLSMHTWMHAKRHGFYPWVGKIPWRRAWQSTPVFLPGETLGQRSWWTTVKKNEVTRSCPTLCDLMDSSLLGSSIHGNLQARVLEWAAISFSRGSSKPRDRTWVSCIADKHCTVWDTRKAYGQ